MICTFAMKRHSTKKSIENTINKLRSKIPDIHIRTTLITGLPGETVYDFEQLYEFINDIKFERLGVFTYSQEEGTVAAAMPDQLPEKIKEERKDIIMRLQMEISLELNKSKIGQVFDVLVEDCEDDGTYIGRTRFDAPDIDNTVLFTSQRAIKKGALVKVKIEDAFDYDLTGTEV